MGLPELYWQDLGSPGRCVRMPRSHSRERPITRARAAEPHALEVTISTNTKGNGEAKAERG